MQSWAINAGSHSQRPLGRWQTGSQVLQVIFCLRRRKREIIWQPAYFSWVVHIFLHFISCPGSGSPRLSMPGLLLHLWQQSFSLRVPLQPPYPPMVNSAPRSVNCSWWVFLAPRAWQSSAAVIELSHFLSSPDAQGRCYIGGVFGGGGLHGLASTGHRSTAVLAVSITARGAGLLRTSPFPARLVCSSDLSEVIDWVFSLFCSFSSPPKVGDDLNIVFKGLGWHNLKTALKALISWQVWENLLVVSVDEIYWCVDLLRSLPSPQQLLLHVDHPEGSVALH